MRQGNCGKLKDIIEELANLVARVGSEVPDQLRTPRLPGTDDLEYWNNLPNTWLEVSVLRNRFEDVSKSLTLQQGDCVRETA
jgi:hypothetical protein